MSGVLYMSPLSKFSVWVKLCISSSLKLWQWRPREISCFHLDTHVCVVSTLKGTRCFFLTLNRIVTCHLPQQRHGFSLREEHISLWAGIWRSSVSVPHSEKQKAWKVFHLHREQINSLLWWAEQPMMFVPLLCTKDSVNILLFLFS